MHRTRISSFFGCLLLGAWLAGAAGCAASDTAPAAAPAQPEAHAGEPGGAMATPDAEGDPIALERAAYERAKPVFDKYCADCHTTAKAQGPEHAEALEHFSMDGYPFGGHHAHELGEEIREVLGADGGEATMPEDDPGVVQGEELALVLAWADAFDEAQAARGGNHEDHAHEDEHDGHEH